MLTTGRAPPAKQGIPEMTYRHTVITFSVPASFAPVRTETANGRIVGIGRDGRLSIDGREVRSISRRGHKDPAYMRDLALAAGAVDTGDLTVTHHVIGDGLRAWTAARYIVSPTGPASPIKVTV